MGRRINEKQGSHRVPESTVELVAKLPTPAKPYSDAPALAIDEERLFAKCEVAIENLKVAFWGAGKALEIVREGRMYRTDYTSFDQYVTERWGMTRGQADKLIRMWPLAQAMFESTRGDSNEVTRTRVKKLNQSVVWELLPVAEKRDMKTAMTVYQATEENAEGKAVTAEVVKGVVKALPRDKEVDRDGIVQAVRTAWQRTTTRTKPTKAMRKKPEASGPAVPATALPWGSPEALNRLAREHMATEDRHTLGKLLLED